MWASLTSWIMVVVLGTSCAIEPLCLVCSKYDYEETLLERVIRNELALKDTLDKITETHVKVEDTLNIIQGENVKLNDVIQALEAKKRDLEDTVDSLINTVIQNASETVAEMNSIIQSLVGQTSKALHVMREQSVVPLVMFHVRIQSEVMHRYTTNQDVVFKTVLINEGGGYDPDTGHFTASVAGVYMFTVQYCPSNNAWAFFEIVHAGRPLQRSTHKGEFYAICVNMQAFAKAAMGDKVRVRSINSASDVYQDRDFFWNSFAGFLLHV